MLKSVISNAKAAAPAVDFWSLRALSSYNEELSVRNGIPEPIGLSSDMGVMVSVVHRGGIGYAATQNTSPAGIAKAFDKAQEWAALSRGRLNFDPAIEMLGHKGQYQSPNEKPFEDLPVGEKINLLKETCEKLGAPQKIVDNEAGISYILEDHRYINSQGADIAQQFTFTIPGLSATANEGSQTQTRSFGGMRAYCRQGGLEVLDHANFFASAENIAQEAVQLLEAPNCPSGKMDLLLMPDQMLLQIHESIGHPLELDRILGDERNYAGTTFVKPDMFGSYQYGSELLNVTFDPSVQGEFASYNFDDDGTRAERTFMIKNGILVTPLGGVTSQARAQLPGVANSRASSWNRPPIDRMANLNVEPGNTSLQQMIASVQKGIMMKSNSSWSIDDSRNKFQFGCEWAQLIENGKLSQVVRNPNYRGISATFWRDLKMVGNQASFECFGSPYCGKGEPNQVIRVGHGSPACLFNQVDVFGGE